MRRGDEGERGGAGVKKHGAYGGVCMHVWVCMCVCVLGDVCWGGWLHIFSDVQIKQERRRETGMRGGGVEVEEMPHVRWRRYGVYLCAVCSSINT